MKTGLRLFFVGLTAIFFAGVYHTKSQAQAGSKVFSHATKEHRTGKYSDCKVCHLVPTTNWIKPRRDKNDPFPDVVNFPVGYGKNGKPNHSSCTECHQRDMHSNPAFCGGCHTMGSKGILSVTGIMAFPNRSRPTQFVTKFPHAAHQEILASTENRRNVAAAHFVTASYLDTKKAEFYNCSICHQTSQSLPKYAARKTDEKPIGPAGKDTFLPTVDYFKDSPYNHASCFNCHYQRTAPVSTDCAGCHKLVEKPYFSSSVAERYSLKFSHEQLGKTGDDAGKKVHAKDCMTCHFRVAGSSDLQSLKMTAGTEVPFVTCSRCHETRGDIPEEKRKRAESKNYQCSYCHTSEVGRYEIPASHQ